MLNFFGLRPADRENVILEPIFLLSYYLGFSYKEGYNIPVTYKRWFIDRIVKELNKSKEDGGGQSRAMHDNAPDVRAMQGRARSHVPSKLRRFT